MKKNFLFPILLIVTAQSFSQLRYYAEVGINQSRPTFLGGPPKGGPGYRANAGITGSMGLIKKIRPAFQLNGKLSFVRKTYHESYWTSPYFGSINDTKVSALQLHFLAEKNISRKRKLQFFPALGIYTTVHTAGLIDYEVFRYDSFYKGERDIVLNGSNPDFKRCDLGLTFGLKTQWRKYFVHFITDAGIIKTGHPAYNRWVSVQFTAGYFLK